MIQTTKKPTATLRKILQQLLISTQVKSKNKEAAFTYTTFLKFLEEDKQYIFAYFLPFLFYRVIFRTFEIKIRKKDCFHLDNVVYSFVFLSMQ